MDKVLIDGVALRVFGQQLVLNPLGRIWRLLLKDAILELIPQPQVTDLQLKTASRATVAEIRGLPDFLSRPVFHSFVCVYVKGQSEIPARCTSSPLAPKWRQFVEGKERESAEAGKVGGLTAQKDTNKKSLKKRKATKNYKKGRLECRDYFKIVLLDGEHYDLRSRPMARACIEFLVMKRAFSQMTARHLTREIDPYARDQTGYDPAKDVRISSYFANDPSKRLKKLRKELIHAVGKDGRFFLKVN